MGDHRIASAAGRADAKGRSQQLAGHLPQREPARIPLSECNPGVAVLRTLARRGRAIVDDVVEWCARLCGNANTQRDATSRLCDVVTGWTRDSCYVCARGRAAAGVEQLQPTGARAPRVLPTPCTRVPCGTGVIRSRASLVLCAPFGRGEPVPYARSA